MSSRKIFALYSVLALALIVGPRGLRAEERGDEHPWNLSFEVGKLDTEGDNVVDDAYIAKFLAGYNLSTWWTVEGALLLAPSMKGNYYDDYSSGKAVKVNRLEQETGSDSTWALGASIDLLLHFTPWKRVDPFLAAGYGVIKYGEDIGENDGLDMTPRVGGGIFYHFNDEWAIRADFRYFLNGSFKKSNSNSELEGGINWTIGAGVPAKFQVSGGPKDSDSDGLSDVEEVDWKTNPLDPDSDDDGLTDYEEVKIYHTDPNNPDTDYDMLKDGPEVKTYGTDPRVQDTDKGGVSDGHEVLEDHTNPRNNPADDLILVTLDITFDYDRTIIRPEFFEKLGIVGKVLERDPGATAKIEGHADKLKKSRADYNQKLSEDRAREVMAYLIKNFTIEAGRLAAKGYGFERPRAANDKINGNPFNRRVEIYIKLSPNKDRAVVAPDLPIGTMPVPMPPL